MCGICVILNLTSSTAIEPDQLHAMNGAQKHRGPDDSGIFLRPQVGLGSTRLSIIDLSAKGHMPMCTYDGRYWIVYNGEVYNFAEIRRRLEERGCVFHSGTDTEVILQSYALDGPSMLLDLNGMFAFAIWDELEKTLFATCDRMGIKPFCYTQYQGRLYFASEHKAIFAAGCPKDFDEATWPELLFFRYVAGENTPYKAVKRLLPGYCLIAKEGRFSLKPWWSLARSTGADQIKVEAHADRENFSGLIDSSIEYRRISDVPVGVLLSGGVDSCTIAAHMAKQAGKDVESFTVRFKESGYDEGGLAREMAKRWALKHHELTVAENKIPGLLDEAVYLLDEPIVHVSDIHLLAISRYAKSKVTVLLSGEGADETLGGYVRYSPFLHPDIFPFIGAALKAVNAVIPVKGRLQKTFRIFTIPSMNDRILYSSAEVFPSTVSLEKRFENSNYYRQQIVSQSNMVYTEAVRRVMYYEQHTYLQSVLDRNDRMTMGASIECRVSYLDPRLVQWLSDRPTSSLFRAGKGKFILRKAASPLVPASVIRHKKWGFGVPFEKYLRTIPAFNQRLRTLSESEILKSCPIGQKGIRESITRFQAGDNEQTALIRQLFMIDLWNEVCLLGRGRSISA